MLNLKMCIVRDVGMLHDLRGNGQSTEFYSAVSEAQSCKCMVTNMLLREMTADFETEINRKKSNPSFWRKKGDFG